MAADWTPERVEQLIKLWAEGLTAGQISDRFRGEFSRNAIVGKALRLRTVDPLVCQSRDYRTLHGSRGGKIASNKTPWRRKPKLDGIAAKDKDTALLAELVRLEAAAAVTDVSLVKMCDLEPHHCRWPVGDPRDDDFGCCGKERVPGAPYCLHHTRRAYDVPPVSLKWAMQDAAAAPANDDARADAFGSKSGNSEAGATRVRETV